ncbi:MAG: fatty acid desaturase [Oligoflexus sp.]
MRCSTDKASQIGSIPEIIRTIPPACFQSSLLRSVVYVLRDYAIVFASAYLIITLHSWLLGPLVAIIMGCGLGGLFVIGHDAGHRSFCKSKKINNFIGHLTTSPVLWPFHIWRIDHDNHHRHTCHIDKDTAWRPTTYKLWQRMPKLPQFVYKWTRSGFFFMGSFYTTYQLIKEGLHSNNSTKLSDAEKRDVKFSLRITLLVACLYALLSVYLGGFYGFVCLFLIPQCVFHFLLSTFTYFHHTAPDTKFLSRSQWRPDLAQLCGSLHVSYPRILESLVHDINWHVPHHVCVGIPHYHLRQAHQALKQRYPDDIKEYNFNLSHVRAVTSQCQFIASRSPAAPDLSWVSFAEERAKQKQARKQRNDLVQAAELKQGS